MCQSNKLYLAPLQPVANAMLRNSVPESKWFQFWNFLTWIYSAYNRLVCYAIWHLLWELSFYCYNELSPKTDHFYINIFQARGISETTLLGHFQLSTVLPHWTECLIYRRWVPYEFWLLFFFFLLFFDLRVYGKILKYCPGRRWTGVNW